jgi:NIPSNAP protein
LIICFLRYFIDRNKVVAFEHYAQVWMRLIEKYGGTHHGYFLPADPPPSATFSFPGVGVEGPDDIAIAIFSFPTLEAYETYRRDVKEDPECHAATRHYEQTKCFTKYERTFLKAIEKVGS